MQNFRINYLLIFLFSFYLYPFIVNGFEYYSYFIIYIIPIIYVFLNYEYLVKDLSKFFHFLIFILIISFIYMISILYNMSYDFSFFNVIFLLLRKYIKIYFLYILTIKTYKSYDSRIFLLYYVYATCIYIVVTLIFIYFPNITNLWFEFINIGEHEINLINNVYAYNYRVGWQGFSGYRMSIYVMIAINIFIYIISFTNTIINKSLKIILFSILVIGILLYARIGLVVFLVNILVFLICISKKNNYIYFFSFIITLTFLSLILSNINENYNDWYIWFFTPFSNFINNGSFSNRSVELLSYWITSFQPDLNTLIIGKGLYDNIGIFYSDIGFIRLINLFGIFGTIGVYIYNTYLSFSYLKYTKYVFPILMFITFIFYEFKGESYYEFIVINIILQLVFVNDKKEEKKIEI